MRPVTQYDVIAPRRPREEPVVTVRARERDYNSGMEAVAFAAVKAKLSEYVDRVHDQQDRVVITRNGTPVAVLISVGRPRES